MAAAGTHCVCITMTIGKCPFFSTASKKAGAGKTGNEAKLSAQYTFSRSYLLQWFVAVLEAVYQRRTPSHILCIHHHLRGLEGTGHTNGTLEL